MLSIGIVGLPNVGKSTLFNALTKSKQADAQNYPFCTIEPNVGVVEVPDGRLKPLSAAAKTSKIIPTAIEFVDIAGLVKGASEGEGLGNKFLSHIREVNAIAHVVRAFTEGGITHVHDRVDPFEDAQIINLELILADLQTISKRLDALKGKAKGVVPKELQAQIVLFEKVKSHLETESRAATLEYTEEEREMLKELQLLTMKPMMYVVNVDDGGDHTTIVEDGVPHVYVSARSEAEIAELPADEAQLFMDDLGMDRSGLDKIIKAGYDLLGLITYFTAGEIEVRAWTVPTGTTAQHAAGEIHTDFIKKFIKAEITSTDDFLEYNGWVGVKEHGKVKLTGKDHVVQDGDVCYFHIGS
jgi:GTP-binding protein YchF